MAQAYEAPRTSRAQLYEKIPHNTIEELKIEIQSARRTRWRVCTRRPVKEHFWVQALCRYTVITCNCRSITRLLSSNRVTSSNCSLSSSNKQILVWYEHVNVMLQMLHHPRKSNRHYVTSRMQRLEMIKSMSRNIYFLSMNYKKKELHTNHNGTRCNLNSAHFLLQRFSDQSLNDPKWDKNRMLHRSNGTEKSGSVQWCSKLEELLWLNYPYPALKPSVKSLLY